MKKAVPVALIVMGIVFLGAGAYTTTRGVQARGLVQSELRDQNIVTPEDATIPNRPVQDAATATAMADVIETHVEQQTGGRTYAEMGRFLAEGGGDTSDEAQALIGDDGQPVRNPLRAMAFEASALRTSLYTSVMAFNLADLVVGLGLMMAALGVALLAIGASLRQPTGRTIDLRTETASAGPQGDHRPQPALG